MTIFLDSTALLAMATVSAGRATVLDLLQGDPRWCASALCLTEAIPAIDRLTDETVLRNDMEDAIRLLWDFLHVVPLDQACLDRATNLARSQPMRMSDAIHFSAALRLPEPVTFVTFDAAQIARAHGLGLAVASA